MIDQTSASSASVGTGETARYRVAIAGSYGNYNLGDEAILGVIITQLRRALPVHITVFSRDAQEPFFPSWA